MTLTDTRMDRPSERNPLRFSKRTQWRSWLEEHHATATAAVLVIHRASHRAEGLALEEAVEEALCYGWIDSTLRSLDERCYLLRFTPRRRNSVWSIRNIHRVQRLVEEGKVAAAGLRTITEAKESGAWEAAVRREEPDEIPMQLARALRRKKGALAGYRALPRGRKKQLLHWLFSARREETRTGRITAIVAEALRGGSPPNRR
jgi:uncharacterized protein YdeI (YjbR/CyaY-like superfamily)